MKPKLFNRRAFVKSAAARSAVAATQRRIAPVQQSQTTSAAGARNPAYACPNPEETPDGGIVGQMA